MRLLAPRRISRSTKASTSTQGQEVDTGDWAGLHGHTIVVATEDLSVSGGVPIRERPEIGPWLTPEHLADWDGIAFSKIDRGFRDHYDFITFVHDFCEPHGKIVISTGEGIDTSTDMGKFMLGMLVQFAEWELTRMKKRRSEAAVRLRNDARWGGGTVSFGRMAVCLCHNQKVCPTAPKTAGWDVVPDPAMVPVVLRMVAMAIQDPNRAEIARWLNEQKIPTAQNGKQWRSSQVEAVLRSPTLRGYVVQTAPAHSKGGKYAQAKIIRTEDGTPVQREAIVDDDTWYQLQAALDGTTKPHRSPRRDAHALLGAGFCLNCGAPLWAHSSVNKRRNPPVKVWYYRCRDSRGQSGECDARGIPQADLNARLESEITARYSATPYPEKLVIPGVDHAREIEAIDKQIAELDQAYKDHELHARAYSRQVSDLETMREALEAEQTPGGTDIKDADDTIVERFLAATPDGRRDVLLDLGIKVYAVKVGKDLSVDLQGGPEPRSLVNS